MTVGVYPAGDGDLDPPCRLPLSYDLPLLRMYSSDLRLISLYSGDLDLLLDTLILSYLGDNDLDCDLDLNLRDDVSLGPSLAASLRSSLCFFLDSFSSLTRVVESATASILASTASNSALTMLVLLSAASSAALRYSLASTTLNNISMKLLVSDCRNTSICCTMDSFSSLLGLSFLIRANTYLARAAGSASHLRISLFQTFVQQNDNDNKILTEVPDALSATV